MTSQTGSKAQMLDAPFEFVCGGVGISQREMGQAGEAIGIGRDETSESVVGLARPDNAFARRQQVGAWTVKRQHLQADTRLLQHPEPALAEVAQLLDAAKAGVGLVAREVAALRRSRFRDARSRAVRPRTFQPW